MTKDEAIKQLKHFKSFHNGSYGEPINMAIEALKQQPCDDTISRKVAIEALNALHYNDREDWCFVLDTVEFLPSAQSEQRWIPCSERLPEYRTEVLTRSSGGFIEIQSLEESYYGYWENQHGDWSDFDEVVAWMPLPEPYREESES